MKRLLILCLLSTPAWASFTLVQHVVNSNCAASSTSCALTVSATGSGHVIIVGFASTGQAGRSISMISGGGSYQRCTACTGSNASAGSSDIAFTLNSASGATSIVVNYSTTINPSVEMVEYSFSGSSVSYDFGNNVDNTTSTTRTGVSLSSLTGSNDILYQIIAVNPAVIVSAITSPYTSVTDVGAGYGFAAAANSTNGSAPTWTFNGNSQASGSAIAIAEGSGGSTSTHHFARIF